LTAIGGGSIASFVYDAFGRRMSKAISGTTTQFLYDGLNPVQELVPATPPAPPVPTANLLTGLGIDEYFQRSDPVNGTLTFMTDAVGSPLALTNPSGAITTSYTYEPFGKVSVTNPPLTNPNTYQFTGRENDGTGLYFYRARYYSPTFQRFLAQDPIDFGGGDTNLYSYVHNQPTTFTDPSGMQEVPVPIEPAEPPLDLDRLGPPSPQCAAPRKITYNECLNAAEDPTD
jgi:RHS repeat-associated protein